MIFCLIHFSYFFFFNLFCLQNFTLKVDINHCNDCVEKAMKKLKKMDGSCTILKHYNNNITYSLGMYNKSFNYTLSLFLFFFLFILLGLQSVKYDTAKEMLRVSGSIDPEVLIKKFDKWGRKAQLYSFDKDSLHIDNGKCKNCCSSRRKTHGVNIKEFDSSSDSGDDYDEENCDTHARKTDSKNISWQHPCPMKSSPRGESPMDKQSTKKSKKFFGGWFGKNDKAAKASGNKNTEGIVSVKSPAASKWHFPRPSMPAYGVPGPFGYPPPPPPPPPYGDPRPYHTNQYPPVMFSRPMRPYYGYGLIPPPPYAFYQPRPPPPPPPRMNPMIHYTSYSDNYYPRSS